MERFSNDHRRFFAEVEQELSVFTEDEDARIVIHYLEMPWITGDWGAFFLLKDNTGAYRAMHRRWDREYDMQRFRMGIFNLDRIAIREESVALSLSQKCHLDEWIYRIVSIPEKKEDTIVLDGIESVFYFHNGSVQGEYRWNTGPEKVVLFAPLIAYMKHLFSFSY